MAVYQFGGNVDSERGRSNMKIQVKYDDYLKACLNFATASGDWLGLNERNRYTTEGLFGGSGAGGEKIADGVFESSDNAHGGLSVKWAFHLSEEEVRKQAMNRYMDELQTELASLEDAMEDDLDYYAPYYDAVKSEINKLRENV